MRFSSMIRLPHRFRLAFQISADAFHAFPFYHNACLPLLYHRCFLFYEPFQRNALRKR